MWPQEAKESLCYLNLAFSFTVDAIVILKLQEAPRGSFINFSLEVVAPSVPPLSLYGDGRNDETQDPTTQKGLLDGCEAASLDSSVRLQSLGRERNSRTGLLGPMH